jgi:hypothetical protein
MSLLTLDRQQCALLVMKNHLHVARCLSNLAFLSFTQLSWVTNPQSASTFEADAICV